MSQLFSVVSADCEAGSQRQYPNHLYFMMPNNAWIKQIRIRWFLTNHILKYQLVIVNKYVLAPTRVWSNRVNRVMVLPVVLPVKPFKATAFFLFFFFCREISLIPQEVLVLLGSLLTSEEEEEEEEVSLSSG